VDAVRSVVLPVAVPSNNDALDLILNRLAPKLHTRTRAVLDVEEIFVPPAVASADGTAYGALFGCQMISHRWPSGSRK
jgi:hypothetical protein